MEGVPGDDIVTQNGGGVFDWSNPQPAHTHLAHNEKRLLVGVLIEGVLHTCPTWMVDRWASRQGGGARGGGGGVTVVHRRRKGWSHQV